MSGPGLMMGAKQSVPRWLYRFAVGKPLDGMRRTDSTWKHRATKSTVKDVERYSWWAGVPGWQRQVVRWLGVVLVAGLIWARATGRGVVELAHDVLPGPVVLLLEVAVWLGLLLGLVAGVRWLTRWRLERQVVDPLAASLRPVVGWPKSEPHRRWLSVPGSAVRLPPSVLARALGRVAGWVRWMRDDYQASKPTGVVARIEGRRLALVARAAGVRSEVAVMASRAVTAAEDADPQALTPRPAPARAVLAVWAWAAALRLRMAMQARVRVVVPVELGAVSSEIREAVTRTAQAKLGGEWVADWETFGRRPGVQFRRREHPPEAVSYLQFMPRMAALGPTELGIGVTIGGRTVAVDLDSDAPHLLLSMGSGAGKSVLLRLLAAQALRKGWAVVVLDFKQDHFWAQDMIDDGTPGLYYLRKMPDIHRALIELETIREWRTDYAFDNRNNDEALEAQRVMILFEEMNISTNMLRSYWAENKQKGDPNKSPALTAFGSLGGAGRSAHMHLVAVGQYLTAQVFGGPEARENFGVRILGRFSVAAWRTLVPEISPVPAKSTIRGRVQVCMAGERSETQVAFLSQSDVVEWASGGLAGVIPPRIDPFRWSLSGPGVPAVPASQEGANPVPELPGGWDGTGEGTGPAYGSPAPAIEAARLPLKAWQESGLLPWDNYETARKNRQRDVKREIFPVTDDDLYTEDQMREWLDSINERRKVK